MRHLSLMILRMAALAALAVFTTLPVLSQGDLQISASANVSANQVGVGETFNVSVQVKTNQQVSLNWPDIGDTSPFKVSKDSSVSQSQQTTIINGKISQSTNYVTNFVFHLTPKKQGTFKVGPVRFSHGSYRRELGSAQITVVKQQPGVILQTSLSQGTAYVGEQVLFRLRIIAMPETRSIQMPDFKNTIGEKFWYQLLDEKPEEKRIQHQGQSVRAWDIRVILFPLVAGEIKIPPVQVDYQQLKRNTRRSRGNSIFDVFEDDFFGNSRMVSASTMSSATLLTARSLPSGEQPEFSGSVGKYSMETQLDSDSTKSGDAVGLTVTIRGNGRPNSIQEPQLKNFDGFELYDPEVKTNSKWNGNQWTTTKTYQYVLIPTQTGKLQFGPILYPYFDPEKKQYTIAESGSLQLNVEQGKQFASSGNVSVSQREIEELGSDIRYIKTGSTQLNANFHLYEKWWFWVGSAFFPGLALALGLLGGYSRKLESDVALRRKAGASKAWKKRIKQAEKDLQENHPKEFYSHLRNAMESFASDLINLELRGMLLSNARDSLQQNLRDPNPAQEYERLIQLCDAGEFAGMQHNRNDMQKNLQDATQWAKNMESSR